MDQNGQYTSEIAHTAAPGGGVVESSTTFGDQTVTVRGGEIHIGSAVPLPGGAVISVDQTELRSPVRLNDQYVVLDRTFADSGVDVDGDGRNDVIDIAIFSRVMGEESIDLPNLPGTSSVRVQTVALARFKQSRSGTYTDISTSTIDIWYANDVGIVKQRTDVPDSLGTRVITVEQLYNWDGVDHGVGFLRTQVAKNQNTGDWLAFPVSVASFDSHALLMSYASAQPYVAPDPAGGIALSKIDARGRVVGTHIVVGIDPSRSQVYRVGDVARVVEATGAGLVMHSFDSSGERLSSSPIPLVSGAIQGFGITGVPITETPFLGVSTGDTLWLVWCTPNPAGFVGPDTLQVQPFDAAGNPVAAPTILATPYCVVSRPPKLAGGADRAIILLEDDRYAIARTDSLTVTPLVGLPAGVHMFSSLAAASGSTAAVLWNSSLPDFRLAGVSVDDSNAVMLSAGTTGGSELLSAPWQGRLQYLQASAGGHLDVYAEGFGYLWPGDITESNMSSVTEVIPGTGPLAVTAQTRLLARGVLPKAAFVASLRDHILLFTSDSDAIRVTSVWRR